MASELLRQARSYEEKNRPLVKQQLPLFHLTGGVGWINDPNGFAPYRRNPVKYRNVRVTGDTVLPGVQGRFVDLLLEIRQEPGETCREFTLEIAKNDDCVTTITLHPREGTITLDRAYSGFNRDIVNQRTFPASLSGETIRFRLILDRYSAELFVGEGEQAASMVLYTPLEADGISMQADTAALVDVEKYEIVVD